MFAWWGRTVYRYRFIVIGVMVALCLGGGIYGMSLGKHVTQSGFYDEGSQSVKASVLADNVYGRDRLGHIVAIFNAPEGKTVDDKEWSKKIAGELDQFTEDHPDQVLSWVGYLKGITSPDPGAQKAAQEQPVLRGMATEDKHRTFVNISLKGDSDDAILTNYNTIAPDLRKLDDGQVELAGLQPLASDLTGTIAEDQQRAEVLALPLVAVVLFFVFGGVVAASLPVIVGGLSIAGALGIMRLTALFIPVHFFAQPVVTLIGLGIAIDYALFIVSRFREEIAEGYDTEAAVRRTVMTSGRTVVFSAVIIVASSLPLLLFPQGFLKSITYAIIASVMFSATLSVTFLPALLAVLGRRVDALGVTMFLKVPGFKQWKPMNWWIHFLASKTQKTLTREEVEHGFWGKLVTRVMKRPVLFAAPILVIMILLIIPLGQVKMGGISEKYLPPDNPVRSAQEDFDRTFPGYRTENLTLVIENATPEQIDEIKAKASQISGFTNDTWQERPVAPKEDGSASSKTVGNVTVLQNGLQVRNQAPEKIEQLRAIQPPRDVTISVGGTPALEQDSIHSLFEKLPLMLVLLITTTTLLMFLAFGSIVLPIKAAVMSALTLGSTLGVLTWIFVDGHGSSWLNFTATPLMAPMIGLIIAVIYGLSTDYEVFLVSRMVEARERGMSTAEAIRIGTATTGRLITAAALILAVVAGAFVFSDLVMMKYLAFGLLIALLLDATVVRMFLVPAIMKLLGDDCWWAPRWMRRIQNRLGLGEIHLPDERKRPALSEPEPVAVGAPAARAAIPPRDPTHPAIEGAPRSGAVRAAPRRIPPAGEAPSSTGTSRIPHTATSPADAKTSRLSVPKKPVPTTAVGPLAGPADPVPQSTGAQIPRANRPAAPPPPREEREIESWLGDLRGGPTSAGPTTAKPETAADPKRGKLPKQPRPTVDDADATTAIPTARENSDLTEKLPAPGRQKRGTEPGPDAGQDAADGPEQPRQPRRGGGVSAQDLLRREGRRL